MGWKTVGIISIILNIIIVISVIVLFNVGVGVLEEEDNCIASCNDYEAYSYEVETGECMCYLDGVAYEGSIN